MATSDPALKQSQLPPTLLSLPPEILDQIFLESLIPDQIWISALFSFPCCPNKSLSATPATLPLVRLTHFVTEAGSQFCVQTFSLSSFIICRELHVRLRWLIAKATNFHFGRAIDTQSLLEVVGPYIKVFGPSRISFTLESLEFPELYGLDTTSSADHSVSIALLVSAS